MISRCFACNAPLFWLTGTKQGAKHHLPKESPVIGIDAEVGKFLFPPVFFKHSEHFFVEMEIFGEKTDN